MKLRKFLRFLRSLAILAVPLLAIEIVVRMKTGRSLNDMPAYIEAGIVALLVFLGGIINWVIARRVAGKEKGE